MTKRLSRSLACAWQARGFLCASSLALPGAASAPRDDTARAPPRMRPAALNSRLPNAPIPLLPVRRHACHCSGAHDPRASPPPSAPGLHRRRRPLSGSDGSDDVGENGDPGAGAPVRGQSARPGPPSAGSRRRPGRESRGPQGKARRRRAGGWRGRTPRGSRGRGGGGAGSGCCCCCCGGGGAARGGGPRGRRAAGHRRSRRRLRRPPCAHWGRGLVEPALRQRAPDAVGRHLIGPGRRPPGSPAGSPTRRPAKGPVRSRRAGPLVGGQNGRHEHLAGGCGGGGRPNRSHGSTAVTAHPYARPVRLRSPVRVPPAPPWQRNGARSTGP
jgi:hypothetical protein